MSRLDHFLVQYRPALSSASATEDGAEEPPSRYRDEARERLSSKTSARQDDRPFHLLESGPFLIAWQGDNPAATDPSAPFLRIIGDPYNVATSRAADIAAGKVWAAGELDGAFAAFAFDPATNQCTLVTDRFGLVPLYAHDQEGTFTWSTSLPWLLALCRPDCRIDPLSVYEMLTLHMILGDRTFLLAVKLVAPATVVHLCSGPPAAARYWTWDAPLAVRPANDAGLDLVHETYALIEQAVLRGVPANVNRVALPLGGGLDVRLVAAVLTRNSVPVQAYAADSSKEAAIARDVARTLGLTLRIPGPLLPAESIPVAHRSIDCAFPVMQVRGWEMARRAAQEDGCEVLFDGHGFDARPSSDHGLLDWHSAAELAQALERSCSRMDEDNLARLVGDSAREMFALVRSSLEKLAQEAIDRAGPRAVEHFFMTNRLRKDAFGSCLANLEHLPGRFPYVTTRLFEHCLRLPADLRRDQALYRRLFVELFPDLARIPCAPTGTPAGIARWPLWLESALRRLSRGRLSLLHRGSFEVEFRRRGQLQAIFLEVLNGPSAGLDGILPEDVAVRAVERHLAGWDLGALLQGLYTVKHFLARFS